jgi:hypothetical protein
MATKRTTTTKSQELSLKLTDEQRAELIRFIGKTKSARIEVDVVFEADLKSQTLAPTTVLVGNAI